LLILKQPFFIATFRTEEFIHITLSLNMGHNYSHMIVFNIHIA